jgi:hypothetical protein
MGRSPYLYVSEAGGLRVGGSPLPVCVVALVRYATQPQHFIHCLFCLF